jgi:hypothetical protein
MRTQRQSGHSRAAQLKDEIYRQMFRLEESRPGADMGLALALLRAWIATGTEAEAPADIDWLKKLTPICLQMIEAGLTVNAAAIRCTD